MNTSKRSCNNPVRHLPLAVGIALGLCTAQPILAADSQSNDSVTIYSSMQPGAVSPDLYRPVGGRQFGGNVPGYGIVRHDRSFDIERGVSTLRVTDVAALIDPTTVTFTSLDEPRTRVVEQNFKFDLVSQAKLMERYLGERITVEQVRGESVDLVEGVLLGLGDGLTLQLDDGTELMFYGLRLSDGSWDSASAGTFVDANGVATHLTADEADITVLDDWASPAGGTYPARWLLQVPRLGLELTVTPVIADQELFTTVRYWEGAVDVAGKRNRLPVNGRGYVELTGYAE